MRTLWALPIGAMLLAVGSIAASPHAGLSRTGIADQVAQASDEPTSQRTINLTAEQRFMIREVVMKDTSVRDEPVDGKIAVGDIVPRGVVTFDFPGDLAIRIPSLKSHSYFVTDGAIVVIDPKDGKIADIVK